MPIYEMICPQCSHREDILAKISDYETQVKTTKCKACNVTLERCFDTPPNFSIPAQHTYNGVTKVSGGKGPSKEKASVPINIIDEKPDGGYKVTRIGKKGDIDND